MKILISLLLTSTFIFAADNEIYVDQSGATANIDLEQLGSGNIIGGLNSSAGSLTALDLDGLSLTLDINQIGDTNKFLGDIYGDFYLDQTGNSRTFNIIQSSTLASDWLQINSTGSNGTVCVVQNDGGTSTSC
jgi:hypothetical protein